MENAQKTVEQRVQELPPVRGQAGAVLEHDQRLQCLEHRLARLQSLTQLNQHISSSLHLDEVLHAIAQAAATLMQAPVASFWLANEATQTLGSTPVQTSALAPIGRLLSSHLRKAVSDGWRHTVPYSMSLISLLTHVLPRPTGSGHTVSRARS